MKKQNGITLVSLIITIVLMLMIAGTTVYTSTNRFKINNLKKMQNDIELLSDKVSSYYLKYGGLPVLRDASNQEVVYTFSAINFETNRNDDANYYIIDLEAIGNITLNYGEEGYKNPNASEDVYIINGKTHTIYYIKGIEYTDGNIYHSLKLEDIQNTDNIPPTTPQINVVSGTEYNKEYNEGESKLYVSDIELEIVPGKNSNTTHYMITRIDENNEETTQEGIVSEERITITDKGDYTITAYSEDENNNKSNVQKLKLDSVKGYTQVEYLESTGTQYINTGIPSTKDYIIKTKASATNSTIYNTICGTNGTFELYFDEDFKVKSWSNITILNDNGNYGIDEIHNIESEIIYNSANKIMLFAYNETGKYPLYGKIYSFSIKDKNGTLIMDLVPLVRQSDGVACMYDKIGNKYYYNAGKGDFLTNLDNYTRVEYLKSTGTQYINTGYLLQKIIL